MLIHLLKLHCYNVIKLDFLGKVNLSEYKYHFVKVEWLSSFSDQDNCIREALHAD
jgi:hypothetical protein